MKTILLVLMIFTPPLAVGSFYENCLLIGELKRLENTEEFSITEDKTSHYVFMTNHSYTLNGSQRNCEYWHGKHIDVTSELKNHINFIGKKSLALHYTSQSSHCKGGKVCDSKNFTVAPYK